MQQLTIVADLDSNVTLAQLELAVKGLRVATEVALDAEMNRVRRVATEHMKFPTPEDLSAARKRWLRPGPRSPIDDLFQRVGEQLARMRAFDQLINNRAIPSSSDSSRERATDRSVVLRSATVGLDVVDPVLYEALVAQEVSREMPGAVGVRRLHYGSPFTAWLFGKSASSDKTISATAQVIEVARDYGPKRKIGKSEAKVAEGTVDDRIADSRLSVLIKEQEYREACARNDRLELENQAMRLRVGAGQNRQMLIDHAIRTGQLGLADAIRALSASDGDALAALGQLQHLEIEQRDGDGDTPQ